MRIRPLACPCAAAVAIAALAATPALAQTPRPERPYRGLFGGGTAQSGQVLTLNVDFGGGYDDNLLNPQNNLGGSADPRQNVAGRYGQTSASLDYRLNGGRVGVDASLWSGASYYPTLDRPFVNRQSGALGLSFAISPHTQFSVRQSVARQPFYLLAGLPVGVDPSTGPAGEGDQALGANLENYLSSESDVSLTHDLSRRVGLSTSYGYRRTSSSTGDRDFRMHTAGAAIRVAVGRGLGVHFGYGYTDGDFGSGDRAQRYRGHSADVGFDFSKALSLTRRTTLSFATGSGAVIYREQTHYFVTGSATLNREIGRTWNAALAYNRSVSYLETFRAPFISDQAAFTFGGLVNRRVQFNSSAGAAIGDVGFVGARNFRTYFASTGVRIGLTRYAAFSAEYAYYRYRFENDVTLPTGLATRADRQSVTVSVNLWAPLVNTPRRQNASR